MADTFGQALLAHLRGESLRCLIHRDDDYVDEDDMRWYFQEVDEWPDVERRALRWVRGRILDIGCGAGRHLLWLQGEGYDAIGIDISPLAVKVSKRRGVEECLVMDARKLGFQASTFDTLLMMGNNFGIAGGPEKTLEMLRGLHRVARRGGVLLVTSRNPVDTDNPRHLDYHEWNRKMGRPPGLVTIRLEFRGEISPWFDLWLATPEEMRVIAEKAGWRLKCLYRKEGARGLYSAVLVRV